MTKEKLLIVLPNWIGDAVMATPLLNQLRKRLPQTKIILGGLPHICSLFEKTSFADMIIPLENRKHASSLPFAGKAISIWNRSRDLKQLEVNKVLLLPGSLSSALSARLGNIPQRIGYNRDGRNFLLTSSIEHPESFRKFHRVQYYLNLLSLFPEHRESDLSATPKEHPLKLETTPLSANWADTFFDKNHIEGPVVAIHGGGAYGPSKRWAPESFAKVLSIAYSLKKFTLIITGSNEDIENGFTIERLVAPTGMKCVMAAGKSPTVQELAALIKKTDLFFSNDSGPMHIAAAFQLRQIAVFTSTSTVFTHPWNINSTTFSSEIDCAPCFARGCPKALNDGGINQKFPCHDSINPEDVAKEINRLL